MNNFKLKLSSFITVWTQAVRTQIELRGNLLKTSIWYFLSK